MVVHVASVGLAQDLQRLEQTPPALARWYRIRLEFVLDGAGADRQPCQSAVREDVERGDILRQPQRVIERRQRHSGADAQPLGARRRQRPDHVHRRADAEAGKMVFGEPHRVEPRLVHDLDAFEGAGKHGGQLDPPLRPAEELQDPDFHALFLLQQRVTAGFACRGRIA
jgi:hypothetical protein